MASTWLVTGANRGIGLELVRQLAARGDRVIATAREPAAAEALAALGVRVEELDVADSGSVARFAGRLARDAVDVLVNNAGIGEAGPGFEQIDWDAADRFLQVNSLGAMRVTQALLPSLRRRHARKIVNVSSELGSLAGAGAGGWYAYRASKAALNMLTRTLAAELRPEGFTCAVVCPGWVRTDMGGMEAPVAPEESVRGLLAVIDRLAPAQSGEFVEYTGDPIAW